MKRILICSPLRQDNDIFHEFRESLDNLEIPEGYSVDFFWVVNNCEAIIGDLTDNYVVINTQDQSYGKDEESHKWTAQNMFNMGELRTICLYQALANGYDYCFLVDTDLILQKETLKALIEADKDVCCEVFWTKTDNEWANAWECDNCTIDAEQYEQWKKPGLYKVGMAGACTLIKRRVIEAGCTYKRIPNLYELLVGEDRFFCVRCACHGFEIWLDTHYPATHLYRRSEYEEYMRLKKCSN